jgi:hypothetical protein
MDSDIINGYLAGRKSNKDAPRSEWLLLVYNCKYRSLVLPGLPHVIDLLHTLHSRLVAITILVNWLAVFDGVHLVRSFIGIFTSQQPIPSTAVEVAMDSQSPSNEERKDTGKRKIGLAATVRILSMPEGSYSPG